MLSRLKAMFVESYTTLVVVVKSDDLRFFRNVLDEVGSLYDNIGMEGRAVVVAQLNKKQWTIMTEKITAVNMRLFHYDKSSLVDHLVHNNE